MKNKTTNLLLAMVAVVTISSCKKDDNAPVYSLNESEVIIHYDETFKFTMSDGASTVDANRLTYFSSNESVGTISDSGEFEAKKIGESTITVKGPGSNELTAQVVVEPYYTLYTEPSVEFGTSIQSVKSYESRTIAAETATSLLYDGENGNIEGVMYLFESNKLTGAIVVLPNGDSEFGEQLATFYFERYQFAGESDDMYFFTDEENGVAIGVGVVDSFGLTASYFRLGSEQAMKAMSGIRMRSVGIRPDLRSMFSK